MNTYRRTFLNALLLVSLSLPCFSAGQQPEAVTITVLGTTDLHGNLFPIDYYANRPANRGLAKVASLIKQVRAESPHVLLVDSGDTIQGTPLAYYFARRDTGPTNPTISVMNSLGYDAMAVGNHEFNFGLDVLWKAKKEARFPMLAANVRQAHTEPERRFGSYVIKEVAGVRVGILGFITPGVPRWEIPAHYRGYEFDEIVQTAQRIVPELRKKVDLLVVIAHSGMERPAESGADEYVDLRGENVMGALAQHVPGIDLILFGHSHRELAGQKINGVLLAQARNWGQSLARADITMERDGQGHWRVAEKRATVIPVTDAVPADPATLELARPYHEATQKFLDAPVATSPRELNGARARYEDHPFVDLIHKVQLDAAQADVSMATMFLPTAHIAAGEVTVRQLASLYIYENTLYAVEITGEQLRQALETSSSYFTAWPLKDGERPKLPGYNADCVAGVSYVVDLTRPEGQRVRDMTYRGKPLDPNHKLRVALNNYRYQGGGQYNVFKGVPVVYRSAVEVRDLLIDYVQRTKKLPSEADGNWKIVPPEAVEAMVAEAKRREEQRAAAPPGGRE